MTETVTEEVAEEVVNKADLYSKITEIHITNFMSISNAVIHMPESGIVGIQGYNDSGKSAIERAIASCLLYRYSHKHKSFIQDGKKYFQVDVVFDDGITIRYEKHYTAAGLYEMYQGDTLLYSNKQQNGNGFYEKIVGVPEEIERYLGMSNTEEGMSLNYGLNTDKQLLVSTSGSENYQQLNQVLKSQEIGLASQLVNRDNNNLGGLISRTEAQIHMKSTELARYGDLDESLVARIKAYAKHVSVIEAREFALVSIYNLIPALREVVLPEVPLIDTDEIVRVSKLERLLGEVGQLGVQVAPEIPLIPADSISRIEKLTSLDHVMSSLRETVAPEIPLISALSISRIEKLNAIAQMMMPLREQVAPEIPAVMGIDRFASLLRLTQAVDVVREAEQIVRDCEHNAEKLKLESAALSKELTEAGHKVVKCNSCGELTLA